MYFQKEWPIFRVHLPTSTDPIKKIPHSPADWVLVDSRFSRGDNQD